jgi:pilus assembly protein Flp/PilA
MRIVLRAKKAAISLWNDESGASLLEYSILIGLIAAGAVVSIGKIGVWVGDQWTALQTALGIQ